jgi:hypothetical protein|tara:strand:+ start:109 stop:627 length:519 start_codon:yes stop_codon:yes gene_type:complete
MFEFDGMSFVKISTMSDVLPCVGPWFEPNFTAHIRTLLTETRRNRQPRTPLQSVKVRHPTKTTNTVHPQKQVHIAATDISAEEAMYQKQTKATESDSGDNGGAESELRSETRDTEEETIEKQSPLDTSAIPSDGGTTDDEATSDTNSTRAAEEPLPLSTTTDAELETEDRDT